MPDIGTAWLRTVVPAAWSWLIAWLIHRGFLSPALAAQLGDAGTLLLVPAVLAVWYPLWRWMEASLPAWLVTLVMGSAKTPVYPAPPARPPGPPAG